MADLDNAERAARRALQLDPRRDLARSTLLWIHVRQERWTNIVQLCDERLAREPSAEWAFNAAKACERLNLRARAEEYVRAGLAADPRDLRCLLGVAAFQLQQATNISGMVKSKLALDTALAAVIVQ